jgi:hypothetical protein
MISPDTITNLPQLDAVASNDLSYFFSLLVPFVGFAILLSRLNPQLFKKTVTTKQKLNLDNRHDHYPPYSTVQQELGPLSQEEEEYLKKSNEHIGRDYDKTEPESKVEGLLDPNRDWAVALVQKYDLLSWDKKQAFISYLLRTRVPASEREKILARWDQIADTNSSNMQVDNADSVKSAYDEFYADLLREQHVGFIMSHAPMATTVEGYLKDCYVITKLRERSSAHQGEDHLAELKAIMGQLMDMAFKGSF